MSLRKTAQAATRSTPPAALPAAVDRGDHFGAAAGAPPLTRRQARELEVMRHPGTSGRSDTSRSRRREVTRQPPARQGRGGRRRGNAASKAMSLAALLLAGAILVGMSVPVNAFVASDSAASAATQAIQLSAGGSGDRAPAQSLAVSGEAASTVPERDGYKVLSYVEQLKLKYSHVSFAYKVTTGAVRWPFPVAVPIGDAFGYRYMCDTCSNFHKGIDMGAGDGAPIYAIADGVVTTAKEDSGYGNHVVISHVINGQPVDSLYAHMKSGSSPLKVGDAVKVGDFVGLVGDTGFSYGSHLHFEIHIAKIPVDPFAWLQANAVN